MHVHMYAHTQKYWAVPPIVVNKVSAANSTPIFWPERTCRTRSGISKNEYVLGKVIRKLYVITTCLFNILGENMARVNETSWESALNL